MRSHAVISGVVSRELSDLQDDWLIQNDFKLGGSFKKWFTDPIIVLDDDGIKKSKDFLIFYDITLDL